MTKKEEKTDIIEKWKTDKLNPFKISIRLLKMSMEKFTRIHAYWEKDRAIRVSVRRNLYVPAYWCSNCNYGTNETELTRYCPWCGAKMDGDSE